MQYSGRSFFSPLYCRLVGYSQLPSTVLFYHSSCPHPGIVGLARIASFSYPDATQFNPESPYYDAKSSQDNPRWLTIDVQAIREVPLI